MGEELEVQDRVAGEEVRYLGDRNNVKKGHWGQRQGLWEGAR